MKDFAGNVLRIAIRSGTISDAEIASIKEQCVTDIKNHGVEGIPLERETEFLWQSVTLFESFVDMAVKQARQLD